jgi:hypothetical protein
MAELEENARLCDWNLRGFPEDLRSRCQKIALDERSEKGKKPRDADIAARLIRQALGLPQPPEIEVLNSDHENGQGAIRRGTQTDAKQASPKDRKNKGAKAKT